MGDNDCHIITQWRAQATRESVYDLLNDAPGLTRWWSAVCLEVREAEPADQRGLGKVVRLRTKGRLPECPSRNAGSRPGELARAGQTM